MPAASLGRRRTGESCCAIPSGNGVGRAKGRQHRGLGDMGQRGVIPPLCSPQLLRTEAHTEVLGQTLAMRPWPEISPSLSKCPQFKPYIVFQSCRCWYGQAC